MFRSLRQTSRRSYFKVGSVDPYFNAVLAQDTPKVLQILRNKDDDTDHVRRGLVALWAMAKVHEEMKEPIGVDEDVKQLVEESLLRGIEEKNNDLFDAAEELITMCNGFPTSDKIKAALEQKEIIFSSATKA